MTDPRDTALRLVRADTHRRLAQEVGFCIDQSNANPIAHQKVHEARQLAAECESIINRLYRGRDIYELSGGDKLDLSRIAERCRYIDRTISEILAAQEPAPSHLGIAAE